MNKSVMYKNGVAVIRDELGNEKSVISTDNLIDILIEENIIEMIKKTIKAFEFNCEAFSNNKISDLFFIPMPTIGTVSIPLFMSLLNNSCFDGLMHTRFGFVEKEKFLAFFILLFMPIGFSMSKKWFNEYVDDYKCECGRKLVLKELKMNLLLQCEKLKSLRNNSNVFFCEDGFYEIDDSEYMRILKSHISLYYDLGYNGKEYQRYYKKCGEIPANLLEKYNKFGIEVIRKFLDENGSHCKVKRK